jgi:hypothetical protein
MISFASGLASPESSWVRTVFQALYEAASARDYDELAMYAGREERTLYFSPRATARLDAAVSRYSFTMTERPALGDVVLLLGDERAADPAWCELPYVERRADEEAERLDREAA